MLSPRVSDGTRCSHNANEGLLGWDMMVVMIVKVESGGENRRSWKFAEEKVGEK